MTGARIFIHPRCASGPAADALEAHLRAHDYDMGKIAVFYEQHRRRYELVRSVTEFGVRQVLQRMDGTQFLHRLGEITETPPEVA